MPEQTHPPLHPIIRPPEDHEIIESPVRDDAALGPTEDLDREPDGAPHRVIGWTALVAVLLAGVVGLLLLAGGVAGTFAALVTVVLAVPVAVAALRSKSARERDRRHPSR